MAKCEVIDLALSVERAKQFTGSSGKTSPTAGPTEDGCAVTRSSYWKATVNLLLPVSIPYNFLCKTTLLPFSVPFRVPALRLSQLPQ